MDHKKTIIKQTDEELLFCIQRIPNQMQWNNIILSEEEGVYRVEVELYDSLEGRSDYKTLGRFNTLEDAEAAFREERILLVQTLVEASAIEIDESGDLVPLSFHSPDFNTVKHKCP